MTEPTFYDVLATPRSPLVVRDGRPFGQGGTMKSLPWIYPSVFAGSLRTMIGAELGLDFGDVEVLNALKQIKTSGALPCLPDKNGVNLPYLPKPFDCVVCEKDATRKVYAVRPSKPNEDEGVDLPFESELQPALLQKGDDEDNFKPTKTAPFWSWSSYMNWLQTENVQGVVVEGVKYPQLSEKPKTSDALPSFPKDERTCVAIDPFNGTASDGKLFSTVGLDLFLKDSQESVVLFSQVTTDQKLPDSTLGALGGRRRLASWRFKESPKLEAPKELKEKAKNAKRVRMILATPAIFKGGWLPGWLNDSLEGAPSVCAGKVMLKLKSVAIDRWVPVSGWSYEKSAPKSVRRMVPAGGVYFFTVEGDVDAIFNEAWFRSVCDDEQDARDGFGVALWGVY